MGPVLLGDLGVPEGQKFIDSTVQRMLRNNPLTAGIAPITTETTSDDHRNGLKLLATRLDGTGHVTNK